MPKNNKDYSEQDLRAYIFPLGIGSTAERRKKTVDRLIILVHAYPPSLPPWVLVTAADDLPIHFKNRFGTTLYLFM